MATTFTYSAVSGTTTLLDSTGTSGDGGGVDLKNLANNAYVMAPAITPTAAGPELFGGYAMLGKFGVAPTASVTAFKCWYVDAQDNTNYDSTSGTNAPTRAPDFVFMWPNVSSAGAFRLQSVPRIVARPPWKHKILVQNVAGQTTTNVNNDNQLIGVTVSEMGT
jgi:hypothetical protein